MDCTGAPMKKRLHAIAAMFLILAQPALAATIDGGRTGLKIVAPLQALGLIVRPHGTARASGREIILPVTGGSADGDPGGRGGIMRIAHEGAGLILGTDRARHQIMDLVIDTAAGEVSGLLDGTRSAIFDLQEDTGSGLRLTVSPAFSAALQDMLGGDPLAGRKFGFAQTALRIGPAPAPVPLPPVLPAGAAALLLLGLITRRKPL